MNKYENEYEKMNDLAYGIIFGSLWKIKMNYNKALPKYIFFMKDQE